MVQSLRELYIKSFEGIPRDIWLLSLITFINRSGTVVFFFISIYLSSEFGFSKDEIGIVMACHGLGSASGSYLGGWLTDQFGYYRVMFWSLFIVGFFFFALNWVETFLGFCIMGFVVNLIGDAFRPAGMASIIAYGGNELRTRCVSLYRLAINFGFGMGMAVAGFIAAGVGYRILFFMDGGTCIFAAFLFIFLLKEKKETETEEKDDSKKEIKLSAYRDGWYLAFILFQFFNAMVFMQLFYTFPLFFKEVLEMSEVSLGWLMAFNSILIAVLEMPLIYIIAKKRDQMGYITWGAALIGLSFLMFNITGFSAFSAFLFILLISAGEIINIPLSSSLALGRSNPNNRGQYMGLYSMLYAIASVLTPLLGFKIAEKFGYVTLWYLMGILGTISTVGFIFLRKKMNAVMVVA